MSINNLKSFLVFAQEEAIRTEMIMDDKDNQIVYLSDKLSKLFHELRTFHDNHGRDLHPEVLDSFNASWRNHEASFDAWSANNPPVQTITDEDL
jgi:hypothetical protein